MSDGISHEKPKGPISWMTANPVAANLLMILLVVGGLLIGMRVKQEVFPDFNLDMVNISVAYPGASPGEVENGVVLAIEEAIRDIEGVDEMVSTSSEGLGFVSVEAVKGADVDTLWLEIKNQVDRIDTFPDEALDPNVSIASRDRDVITIALFGSVGEAVLREAGEQARDEFLSHPDITRAELSGVRDHEIHVEAPTDRLRMHGLTLGDIASAIRSASVEMGGGALKTESGDLLVRVDDRRDYAAEYARLPLLTQESGARIFLGDVAAVSEGFEDTDSWAFYNGEKAVLIEVYRVGDQTPARVAAGARAVMERLKAELPPGLHLEVVRDLSLIFEQRAELLLKNAGLGLILVFILLALFLEPGLAFWVSMGIPISFLGAFLIMGNLSISINMVTMFAFIVTLGIVVDDAVVVGENIYHFRRRGLSFFQAAVKGARGVALPVVFSVLTNMAAFLPMFFVPGVMGKIFRYIPMVVISVFAISLVESLFVLPSHLSHGRKKEPGRLNFPARWQRKFSAVFEAFVRGPYARFLTWVLSHRYSVIALGVAMLMATAGYLSSGRLGMEMFPKVESDYAYCEAVLPYGSPASQLMAAEGRLVQAAREVGRENGGEKLVKGVFSRVSGNRITVRFYLTDPDIRPVSTGRVTTLWRERAGKIPGLESLAFESDRGGPGSGRGLSIQLSHRNKDILERAGAALAEKIEEYPMAQDIDDGSARGKRQRDIRLMPAGERMGLTSREVAAQLRGAFYGIEAVKNQRGRNELTVRVRLPESERASESTLDDLTLLAPRGEIPLRNAVEIIPGRAYTSINRTDGRRVISVTANVRPRSQADTLKKALEKDVLPDLKKRFPGLSHSFKGRQAETRESVSSLMTGLAMALILVYALLAVPLKSYLQPVIIMFCIPFGMIGAVLGHIIMGYSLSVISLFGIVALAGVVINDSLVFVDFANQRVRKGKTPKEAVIEAGIQRFRPILLTTLTTSGGLAPMIFETSRQARFLIPMAISLGFGILFATFITLAMIPSLYLLTADLKRFFGFGPYLKR
ncbi:MdtB: multidrug resistance protein, AcrB/AcrD/AcrF family [Candidatus Desulfarcum epimagneticum]|uniref:MdtB: multidrug resistance protein, AcrB/AcrD/AcrF family n=1 Tax=uncultured Desulfobacteraceae bacterium TaxID=218296 RepID=A0A484HMD6_9BACT|nr:MdtB: multidrug resistance protein, AcrB/AcrD/AcrF family [uncultured Desulfobacteraceae bacterium]